jgi:hypothetical protein
METTKKSYAVNSRGSVCIEESKKDRVILLSKEDSKRPVRPEFLRILDRSIDDEPGMLVFFFYSLDDLFVIIIIIKV